MLLFLSLLALLFVRGCDALRSSQTCPYEALPVDLNASPAYLQLRPSMHIYGDFAANFSVAGATESIAFKLSTRTSLRFTVAPHADMDVDVFLQKVSASGAKTTLAYSELGVTTAETVAATLDADASASYELQLVYVSAYFDESFATVECGRVTLELAMAPVDALDAALAADACASTSASHLPSISVPSLAAANAEFHYDSTVDAPTETFFAIAPAQSNERSVTLKSYSFTLPSRSDAAFWYIEAVLGVDFLTSGSLGLALTNASVDVFDLTLTTSRVLAESRSMNHKLIKTAVPPGQYKLWLYDRVEERNVSACAKLTLRLLLEASRVAETYATCAGVPLPAALDQSALSWSDSGVYRFFERNTLVNMSAFPAGSARQTIAIAAPASHALYLRALVESAHSDIDIELEDATGQRVAGSYRFEGADSVAYVLAAGASYKLSVLFYGWTSSVHAPCETYLLDLMMAPSATWQDLTPPLCVAPVESTPPLAGTFGDRMSVAASGSVLFNADASLFMHVYEARAPAVLASANFSVASRAVLLLAVQSHFLIAPMTARLVRTDTGAAVARAVHTMDGVELRAELEPDVAFTLSIETEVQQTAYGDNEPLADFPACGSYTFDARLLPAASAASRCVDHYYSLPGSLNRPAHLGTSDDVHMLKQLRVPTDASVVSQNMSLVVFRESFVRVWVAEPAGVDIDLILYADDGTDTIVAAATNIDQEETIMAVLEPNAAYKLRVQFYHGLSGSMLSCVAYAFELALEPIDASYRALCPTADDVHPPTQVALVDDAFELAGDVGYYFNQHEHASFSMSTQFTLTKASSYFHARLEYEFLKTDLSLLLLRYDDASSTQVGGLTEVARGRNALNANEIAPLTLPAGAYMLLIYEPAALEADRLRGCAHYTLRAALQPAANMFDTAFQSDEHDVEQLACRFLRLPASLDAVAYLSPRAGAELHLQQTFTANAARRDELHFTLTQRSLARIFVPSHAMIDIDVTLYQGASVSSGTSLATSNGYEDEAFVRTLAPGAYVLQFRYYSRGAQLSRCMSFAFELALTPTATLAAVPALAAACSGTFAALPTTATAATLPLSSAHYRHATTAPFSASVAVTLSRTPSSIAVDASFEFASGSLALMVTRADGAAGHETLTEVPGVRYGASRAFFVAALAAGTYNVTLYDTADDAHTYVAAAGIQCSPFAFSLRLLEGAVDGGGGSGGNDPTTCLELERLPADVSSGASSWAYGGPQNGATGQLHLYGTAFWMGGDDMDGLGGSGTSQFLSFRILEPSYVRFFVQADSDRDDIDFFLWRTSAQQELITFSASVGAAESALLHLAPQTEPYQLQVYFFHIVDDELGACRTFHFEMDIRPTRLVAQELRCPVPLPNQATLLPPSSLLIDSSQDVSGDTYYFSGTSVAAALGDTFRYRVTLVVVLPNVDVSAEVGFDFLANDFRLRLRDAATDAALATGVCDGADDRGSYINFRNALAYRVQQGTYYLDIEEDLTYAESLFNQTNVALADICHRFAFTLTVVVDDNGSGGSDDQTPRVESVTGSMSDLSPRADLSLWIAFSTEIASGAATDDDAALAAWLAAEHVLYLTSDAAPTTRIAPDSASLWALTALQVTFIGAQHFAANRTYTLHFDATKFRAVAAPHHAAAPFAGVRRYGMRDCACNGHGHCVPRGDDDVACDCAAPYAGDDCTRCEAGTHGVGTACVADVPCSANYCSGHGRCDASSGVPVCHCDVGYALNCSACAAAYTGYPACVRLDSAVSRDGRCTAPLMPVTLDSVAYLSFDGATHFARDFYVDVKERTHIMRFTVRAGRPSLLRVHVEEHWVDIDVWLYRVSRDDPNRLHYVQAGVGIGTEEVIFEVLEADATRDTEYALHFRYWVWWDADKAHHNSDCETFSLQLAMAPLAALYDSKLHALCAAASSLPAFETFAGDKRTLADGSLRLAIGEDGLSYAPTQTFVVRAPSDAHEFDADKPMYPFNVVFDVAVHSKPGMVAVLKAEVRAQFLTGDLSLLLENGVGERCKVRSANFAGNGLAEQEQSDDDDSSLWDDFFDWLSGWLGGDGDGAGGADLDTGDAADGADDWSAPDDDASTLRCLNGRNLLNRNVLETELAGGGTYTLSVYEPRPQKLLEHVPSCAAFEFAVSIEWVQAASDVFHCDAAELPADLNLAQYMDDDGFMHVVDDYAVTGVVASLRVATDSVLRVQQAERRARISLRRASAPSEALPMAGETPEMLLATLAANVDYVLRFDELAEYWGAFCGAERVEIAVEPKSTPYACGGAGASALALPSPLPVPLAFSGRASAAAYAEYVVYEAAALTTGGTLQEFEFTVDDITELKAAVASEFLRANLRVALYVVDTAAAGARELAGSGKSFFNDNRLLLVLGPGTYVLAVEQPLRPASATTPGFADAFPACVRFNFEFYLTPLAVDALAECFVEQATAELLPPRLDSLRFLGNGARRMRYASDSFLVPPESESSFRADQSTVFSVDTPSLMRVYVEPHVVDIDVSLYEVETSDPSGASDVRVAHGEDNFNDEESFVHELAPSKLYRLTLHFYRWTEAASAPCLLYNMEMAVSPLRTPRVATCDAEHWPSVGAAEPDSYLALPFEYDSLRPTGNGATGGHVEVFRLQQRASEPRAKEYRLQVAEATDFHFEVGYEFLRGDLVLSLRADDAGDLVYYGVNRLGRNVLNVLDAAAGAYTLRIYEPIQSAPSALGCVEFTFIARVEAAVAVADVDVVRVPDSLGSLAYLGGNDALYVHGRMRVLDPLQSSHALRFTLDKPSVVRVSYDLQMQWLKTALTADDGTASAPDGSIAPTPTGVVAALDAGAYTLTLSEEVQSIFSWFPTLSNLALIVRPQQTVRASNAANLRPPTSAACDSCPGVSCITPPATDEHGFYQARYDKLRVSSAELRASPVLQNVTFTLAKKSVLFARVAFDHLLYPLSLRLGASPDDGFYDYAVDGHNYAELNLVIGAGDYTLSVFQPHGVAPAGALWTAGGAELLPECAQYEATLIVQRASDAGTYQDCSMNALLPAKLADNETYLYGERFLMAPAGTDQIEAHFLSGSVMSWFVAEATSEGAWSRRVSTTIEPALAPRYEYAHRAGRYSLAIFYVPAGSYALRLDYGDASSRACKSMAMQLVRAPLADAQRRFVCALDAAAAAASAPPATATADARNVTGVWHAGVLTPAFMTAHTANATTFQMDVAFSVAQPSTLRAAVAFHSLSLGLTLALRRVNKTSGVESSVFSSARFAALPRGGSATLEHKLLAASLQPADYVLRVEQERQGTSWTLDVPYSLDTTHTMCLPYVFNMVVAPAQGVRLVELEPPGGDGYGLGLPLRVDVLDTAGAAVDRDSFWLVLGAADGGAHIRPERVDRMSATRVSLSFDTSAFEAGGQYYMHMRDDLRSAAGEALVLGTFPRYSMIDSACNHHGNYDAVEGRCQCNEGWGGATCVVCDTDYVSAADGTCAALANGGCHASTCGCREGTGVVDERRGCTPLGQCHIVGMQHVCQCVPGYDPAHDCAVCAAGYQHWPRCEPCPASGCDHIMPGDGSPSAHAGMGGGTVVLLLFLAIAALAAAAGLYVWRRRRRAYVRVGHHDAFETEMGGFSGSVQLDDDDHSLI